MAVVHDTGIKEGDCNVDFGNKTLRQQGSCYFIIRDRPWFKTSSWPNDSLLKVSASLLLQDVTHLDCRMCMKVVIWESLLKHSS